MKFLLSALLCCLMFTIVAQEKIPFRNDDDYDITLDYDFKLKPVPLGDNANYKMRSQTNNTTLLPHLTIVLTLMNVKEEEMRVRVIDGDDEFYYASKIKDKPIEIELGFTDDMKEGVKSNVFYIFITNKKRDPLNQIVLRVEKDGSFYINDQLHGKL